MDRTTAVVRGTGSSTSAASAQPSFASTWGPSTASAAMSRTLSKHRRGTNPNEDMNASFHSGNGRAQPGPQRSDSGGSNNRSRGAVNADEPLFQPAFAFDVNDLVSSLRRSVSTSSLSAMGNSSNSLLRSGSSHGWQNKSMTPHAQSQQQQFNSSSSSNINQIQYPEPSQIASDARIQVVPVEPMLARRGRRDALSGGENSRSQVVHDKPSIISYNMNRRKKKPIVGMPTDPSSSSSAYPPASPSTYPYSLASPAASPVPFATPPPPLYRGTSNNSASGRRNQTPSPPPTPEFRPTTTITTPNGIEYTTEVPTRNTRVTSFYEESFTF